MTRIKPQLALRSSTAYVRPAPSSTRKAAAWALLAASAALDRLAHRLAMPALEPERTFQEVEFYAQAGAPEGALYVDGQLVGWLQGVRRL